MEIEESIFARVCDAVPDQAGDRDIEYATGLRDAITGALEFVLTGIEHGRHSPAVIPPATVAQAQRAVRNGVSLGTVLRRYTAGYALLGDFVLEEAQSSNHEAGLRELLGAQASSFERLTATIAEEYGRELKRTARSPARHRIELVQRLLAGEASPELTHELGYDLDGWHLAAIATGPDPIDALEGLRAALHARMLSVTASEQITWAWLASGHRKIEPPEIERFVTAEGWSKDVSLAAGEPGRQLAGWRTTHQQAQAAHMVLRRSQRRFARYGDVALLAAVLKDQALVRALLDTYLVPLQDSREGHSVLQETLRAYCVAGRNISATATTLNVARSTIESRLRTIEERLGRTLHPYPPELEIALHLDKLTQ
jgi:hypothetical protein